jgi:hypothetical protein
VRIALVVVMLLAGCGGDDCRDTTCGRVCGNAIPHCSRDAVAFDAGGRCDPLAQLGCAAGEKCTWMVDALLPQYVGHIWCAPDGSKAAGDACTFGPAGATGYDDCQRGLVCSAYRGGAGVCKQICDQQGGQPGCGDGSVCLTRPGLFETSDTTPRAAGVCELECDPLTDNDFDGAGTASTKSTATCGTDPAIGCYGAPSFGTLPATTWTCMPELHPTASLRHRVHCSDATGCVVGTAPVEDNSCSQGYLPLLTESTLVTTAICVALCKPRNCYAGNCGTNDGNRLGEAPHRCNTTDRVGTFDTGLGGEHCTFMWYFERNGQTLLRSPSSDTLGFCYDHGKYGLAACASLSLADAAKLGCVDSVTAGL